MIRIIATTISLALAGCAGATPRDLIAVKPSSSQLETAARKIVCQSFKPVRYSKKGDTPETIKQVRGNNAALGSFKCGDLK